MRVMHGGSPIEHNARRGVNRRMLEGRPITASPAYRVQQGFLAVKAKPGQRTSMHAGKGAVLKLKLW